MTESPSLCHPIPQGEIGLLEQHIEQGQTDLKRIQAGVGESTVVIKGKKTLMSN